MRSETGPEHLTVVPGAPAAASRRAPSPVDPRGDHRIAMALALTGLRLPGVAIRDPEVVGKSFPGFWRALAALGARVGDEAR